MGSPPVLADERTELALRLQGGDDQLGEELLGWGEGGDAFHGLFQGGAGPCIAGGAGTEAGGGCIEKDLAGFALVGQEQAVRVAEHHGAAQVSGSGSGLVADLGAALPSQDSVARGGELQKVGRLERDRVVRGGFDVLANFDFGGICVAHQDEVAAGPDLNRPFHHDVVGQVDGGGEIGPPYTRIFQGF